MKRDKKISIAAGFALVFLVAFVVYGWHGVGSVIGFLLLSIGAYGIWTMLYDIIAISTGNEYHKQKEDEEFLNSFPKQVDKQD
jgi:hypothetical protein